MKTWSFQQTVLALIASVLLFSGCPQPEPRPAPKPQDNSKLKEDTVNKTQNMKDLFKDQNLNED